MIASRTAELIRDRAGTAGHALDLGDMDRFLATIERMPPIPASVLDVGCGTGVLVDMLGELGYDARGVDTDPEAMKHMSAPHAVGTIDAIPAEDRSVDVAVANEVLEHLPVDVYPKALTELARVARQRVIVTVPNAESLESASTRCPQCSCIYSVHGHVRRFDAEGMRVMIPGFTLTNLDTVGPYKVRHRSIEWYVRRRLLGRWPSQPGVTCPQCGFRQPGKASASGSDSLLRRMAGFPWQRWWLVAQYDR